MDASYNCISCGRQIDATVRFANSHKGRFFHNITDSSFAKLLKGSEEQVKGCPNIEKSPKRNEEDGTDKDAVSIQSLNACNMQTHIYIIYTTVLHC